jgi:hypothetical protein
MSIPPFISSDVPKPSHSVRGLRGILIRVATSNLQFWRAFLLYSADSYGALSKSKFCGIQFCVDFQSAPVRIYREWYESLDIAQLIKPAEVASQFDLLSANGVPNSLLSESLA